MLPHGDEKFIYHLFVILFMPRYKNPTLEELISEIYENRQLIFSDECERVLKCGKKKEKVITIEAWNHERKQYSKQIIDTEKTTNIENQEQEQYSKSFNSESKSVLNAYLLERDKYDFAKKLFLKDLNPSAKKGIKREVKQEISHIKRAFRELCDVYHKKSEPTLSEIFAILSIIDDRAKIRDKVVLINGAEYIPPQSYYEIQCELGRVEEEILKNKKIDYIQKAFHIHYHFVRIHPFSDGNGRSARTWSNAYLYSKEILPLLIPLGERRYYSHLLDKACLSHRKDKELTYLTREERKLFKYFAIKLNNEYEDYMAKTIDKKIKQG